MEKEIGVSDKAELFQRWHRIDREWVNITQVTEGDVRSFYTNGVLEDKIKIGIDKVCFSDEELLSLAADNAKEIVVQMNKKAKWWTKLIHFIRCKIKCKPSSLYYLPFEGDDCIRNYKIDNRQSFILYDNGIWELYNYQKN